MPAADPDELTAAVLRELQGAADPRWRAIMTAAVRHLHAFAREVQLTEPEFQQACAVVARLGQASTASHNEVVLAAGSLGLSALVCRINNPPGSTANLLGPFWRAEAPRVADGGSIVRSPTPGEPVFVTAWITDIDGRPVAGAEVDVWQASGEGFYENQDPQQADMNLRGRFTADAQGRVRFRTVKPQGYPIPVNGPVGDLLRAQGRHNLRPAHIHFLIAAPGFKTQFAQLYSSDDPHLHSDVQFAVTPALVGHYLRHDGGTAPEADVTGPWYTLEHRFVIGAGESRLPRPPITGKATAPRPGLQVLSAKPAPPAAA